MPALLAQPGIEVVVIAQPICESAHALLFECPFALGEL